MPYFDTKDASIYYEIHGKGKPLVFINGLSSNHRSWDGVIKDLQKEHKILIFDNRGAGKTKFKDSFFTLETMAKDTIDLIKYVGLEKPHILGHSMGGAIAQIIATNFFDKVDKIVLSSTSSKFNFAFLLFASFFLSIYSVENVSSEDKIKSFLAWGFSGKFLEKNLKYIMKKCLNNPYPVTQIGLKRQLEALKLFDVRKSISKIKSEVLLIRGEKDIIVLLDEMEFILNNISNIEFFNIDAGHDHYIEKPEIFIKKILEFLNK